MGKKKAAAHNEPGLWGERSGNSRITALGYTCMRCHKREVLVSNPDNSTVEAWVSVWLKTKPSLCADCEELEVGCGP